MVNLFGKPRNRFIVALIVAALSVVWDLRGVVDNLQIQIDKLKISCLKKVDK